MNFIVGLVSGRDDRNPALRVPLMKVVFRSGIDLPLLKVFRPRMKNGIDAGVSLIANADRPAEEPHAERIRFVGNLHDAGLIHVAEPGNQISLRPLPCRQVLLRTIEAVIGLILGCYGTLTWREEFRPRPIGNAREQQSQQCRPTVHSDSSSDDECRRTTRSSRRAAYFFCHWSSFSSTLRTVSPSSHFRASASSRRYASQNAVVTARIAR